MSIAGDIEYIIQAHGAWKTRFRDFLNGKAGMDLSHIGQSCACELGRWLDDTGKRALSPEDHAEANRLHTHFHQVAGEIVHHIKQKDFASARTAIAPNGTFDQASHDLASFLRRLELHQPHPTAAAKGAAPVEAEDGGAPGTETAAPPADRT